MFKLIIRPTEKTGFIETALHALGLTFDKWGQDLHTAFLPLTEALAARSLFWEIDGGADVVLWQDWTNIGVPLREES